MDRNLIDQSARPASWLSRIATVAAGIVIAGCLVSAPASAKEHNEKRAVVASHPSASTDISARRYSRGYRHYRFYRPHRRYGYYRPYRRYGFYRPYYRPYYRRAYYPYYRPYYRPYYAANPYYNGYGYGYGGPSISFGFGRGFGYGYGFGPRFGFGF
jgi:hypothetical protein